MSIKSLISFLILFSFPSYGQQCVEDIGYRSGMEIWTFYGQSNMVGSPPIDYSIPTDPSILKWDGQLQDWVIAQDPINTGWYGPGYSGRKSLGMAFAHHLMTKIDSLGKRYYCPIGLVSCAVSGKCIDELAPGTIYYNTWIEQTLAALDAAPPGSRIAGILYLQGECDAATEENAIAFYDKLFNLIINSREDLGDQNIPFTNGEIGDFRPFFKDKINESVRSIGQTLPYTSYVESQGLTSWDGGHHFDGLSMDKLGVRFAESFVRIDKLLEPKSPWKNLKIK